MITKWQDTLNDYDWDDGEDIVRQIIEEPQRRRNMSQEIKVVELEHPIPVAGEQIKFFGINDGGYGGKVLIWPFQDDQDFTSLSRHTHQELGSGGTIKKWHPSDNQDFDGALEWLQREAAQRLTSLPE